MAILLHDGEVLHQHAGEVLKFRELLSRNWVVCVQHIYREDNKVTGFLTIAGHDLSHGFHDFNRSNTEICSFLLYYSMK
ncbi:hypothetical protein LINPERPRIM_LOCUS17737 [Linum perenne]